MQPTPRSLAPAVLATVLALPALARQANNDMPLSNGGEVLYVLPTPTVGSGPAGWGELYWRTLPGDRLLAHQHGATGDLTMEIDGFHESLYDSDWTTPPFFFDRYVGPAVPNTGGCGLEPAFLQSGLTSETLVSLGPSGFGSPCTIVPSLCSPTTSTCTGVGWLIDITFSSAVGSGVVVPADGTQASDLAVTYVVPGGMTTLGGACGTGDYVNQTLYSTDETQHDDCGGVSTFSGFHLPGLGAVADPLTDSPEQMVAFRQPVLNAVADSGLGVEVGANGGGALNGLKLDTSGGVASLGFEVRDHAGVGQLALVSGDVSPVGPPGAPFLGAYLLVRPTRDELPTCFRGPVGSAVYSFTLEGAFLTCQLPLPAVSQPRDTWWQALILDPSSGTARNTNRVRTTLY